MSVIVSPIVELKNGNIIWATLPSCCPAVEQRGSHHSLGDPTEPSSLLTYSIIMLSLL